MAATGDPIGAALVVAVKATGSGLKAAFQGIKKLKTPGPLVGLLLALVASAAAYFMRETLLSCETVGSVAVPVVVRYLIYWLLLLIPLWYLIVLGSCGSAKAGKYDDVFLEIGFTKEGRLPVLLAEKVEGKKTVYVFKAKEPLSEWRRISDRLEIGLDCNIRVIQEGRSKGIAEITTVPSSYKIPTMLPWSDEYIDPDDGVITIGESDLETVSFDLNRTAHVLAAGETGSGKSVVLRAILWQLINKGCCAYMIDFKGGVEFGKEYEQFGEVITERTRALAVLDQLTRENDARLKIFRELGVKNLKDYNKKTGEKLCRVAVVVDEIGEMMDSKGADKETKEIMDKLQGRIATLARMSRATGINLLLGVQRPDANVLPGQIKNNIPVRICGRFADKAASEIVLGNTSACGLPDIKGRFLYKVGNETIQFQSYYFDDEINLRDVAVEQGEMLTSRGRRPKSQEEDTEDWAEEGEELPPGPPPPGARQHWPGGAPHSSALDLDYDDGEDGDG